ncbi:Ig-like domain-containing protein, partial [Enterococcus quebecensis]
MNKKKWYLILTLIMVPIICTSFFYLKTEPQTRLKAEENKKTTNDLTKTEPIPPEVADQTLLSKYNLLGKWEGYNRYGTLNWISFPSWDGTTSKNLVADNTVKATATSSDIVFKIDGNISNSGLVKNTIRTIPGHYYQLSTEISATVYSGKLVIYALDLLSNSDVNNPVSIYPDYSELIRRELGPTTIKKVFQATTNELTLVFSMSSLPHYFSSTKFQNTSIIDLNQGIVESRASLAALYTDSTQTELKLSTTQLKINETQKVIDTVVHASISAELKKELAKAQALLDKITMTLKIPAELVNDHKNEQSHTITGSTYPNSFVQFSGIADFPEGTLYSEVADDTRKYQIRADNDGKFTYSLPEGKYFKEYETVTVFSMLRGKTASQVRVIKDTVPPEQPVLNPIKDADGTISGQAESGSTVNIYDKGNETLFLTGKADSNGQFSIPVPAAKKPIIPYKVYYSTSTDAAGNTSVASDTQVVADTTAPKAEAVKQALTLGNPLPAVDKMLKNISDNAGIGADNLTIKMTKVPDISQTGYKTAE